MTAAELLLEKSLDHYRDLLEKTLDATGAVKSSNPEKIKAISAAIDQAQDRAKKIERELDPFFREAPELMQSPQFIDRLALIERILLLTESCTPRFKAAMTINRDEMKRIVGGRSLMGKYHSAPDKKGGLINSSG
ncbi:MAG: hypothetical protein KKD01_09740 [Proteobacteria bacterium]|nr:hypothetical protein [Pseudomonadota bacterium]MBU1233573.1 hypothetical protein [Pseudomonadota bacterium]MBU1420574.1 hypothetical protein [Pseudomonadota bacterium]MBU1454993.1 hypothetical protein [Pseudomonadota bacterium]